MARINNGKGFKNFDIEAHKIEQKILKEERENAPKKGRPKKPRTNTCIYCANKFSERIVDIDLSNYASLKELYADYGDEDLTELVCSSCDKFWGLNRFDYGIHPNYPGWDPHTSMDRLDKAEELGYITILKSQTFGTPSGNNIEIEFGDIFPVKRVSAKQDGSVKAIDFYSIDILVGVENLRLFPWEFGTISWTEIMLEIRDNQYEAVYLGNDDVAGYFEPVPEVREMLKNAFGER